jgi:hypothetical protein
MAVDFKINLIKASGARHQASSCGFKSDFNKSLVFLPLFLTPDA